MTSNLNVLCQNNKISDTQDQDSHKTRNNK
jgi:hypothetical protein